MKKKRVALLLCAAMVASLAAGCGNGGSSDEGGSSGDPVAISYACWDSNQAKLIQTIADEFEDENPNIKIDIQVTWLGRLLDCT